MNVGIPSDALSFSVGGAGVVFTVVCSCNAHADCNGPWFTLYVMVAAIVDLYSKYGFTSVHFQHGLHEQYCECHANFAQSKWGLRFEAVPIMSHSAFVLSVFDIAFCLSSFKCLVGLRSSTFW